MRRWNSLLRRYIAVLATLISSSCVGFAINILTDSVQLSFWPALVALIASILLASVVEVVRRSNEDEERGTTEENLDAKELRGRSMTPGDSEITQPIPKIYPTVATREPRNYAGRVAESRSRLSQWAPVWETLELFVASLSTVIALLPIAAAIWLVFWYMLGCPPMTDL